MNEIESLRALVKRDLNGDFAYAQPVAYGPQSISRLLEHYDNLVDALSKIERIAGSNEDDADGYYRIAHDALASLEGA